MEKTSDFSKSFNSERFLETFHGSVDENSMGGKTIRFALSSLNKYFNSDVSLGSYLLDVGTGPTIWSVLNASRRVQHIFLSDISSNNLDILNEWKNGRRSDVISHLQVEMDLAGESVSVSEREAQIRSKIAGIHLIDVRKENVFQDANVCGMTFDVITSSFCLESASHEKTNYISSVQNISKLLKPGGYIALIGSIEESYYRVDKFQYPVCHLTTEEVRAIYEDNGFQILSMDTLYQEDNVPEMPMREDLLSDYKNVFSLFAKKISS